MNNYLAGKSEKYVHEHLLFAKTIVLNGCSPRMIVNGTKWQPLRYGRHTYDITARKLLEDN